MSEHREQGVSLLDLAPAFELVPVGEKDGKPVSLRVVGVSAKGVVTLFTRFPEVQKWFAVPGQNIRVAQLVAQIPGAIEAIIAAGCGSPGNEAAEDMAGNLPVEVQLDVLEAIGRLTFKNGFGPFVKRMLALSNAAQSANYGRAQDTKSPPASKPSLQPDTTPKPSGT